MLPKWFLGAVKFVSVWCWREGATVKFLRKHQILSKQLSLTRICFVNFSLPPYLGGGRGIIPAYLLLPGFSRQRLGLLIRLVQYINQGMNKFLIIIRLCPIRLCSSLNTHADAPCNSVSILFTVTISKMRVFLSKPDTN